MATLQITRTAETLTVSLGAYQSSVPWSEVAPNEQTGQQLFDAADEYGRTLFARITNDEGLRSAVLGLPTNDRLALAITDPQVAALPWEYMRDANNHLLASRLSVVRSVPSSHPSPALDLAQPLTIVAVPVSPVDDAHMLNTEREWQRLVEAVTGPGQALTLSRVRPPTLAKMEESLPGKGITILQFMGHSGIVGDTSVLVFEDQNAHAHPVDAAYFSSALTPQVFLVVLNSCESAVTARTEFGNIAQAVVAQGVPYALGMQFVLLDDAALEMSNTLYRHLLQGRSVEEAVRRTRRALEQHAHLPHPLWLAGIPALYTSLAEPAPSPCIVERQPSPPIPNAYVNSQM